MDARDHILKANADRVKNIYDSFEKARTTHPIGAVKEFGGRKYIKTAAGWKYYGKGTGSAAQSHKQATSSQQAQPSTPRQSAATKRLIERGKKLIDEFMEVGNRKHDAELDMNDAQQYGTARELRSATSKYNKLSQKEQSLDDKIMAIGHRLDKQGRSELEDHYGFGDLFASETFDDDK